MGLGFAENHKYFILSFSAPQYTNARTKIDCHQEESMGAVKKRSTETISKKVQPIVVEQSECEHRKEVLTNSMFWNFHFAIFWLKEDIP